MSSKRMMMICETRLLVGSASFDVRHPELSDTEAFGALLYNAYQGAVDYDDENLAESVEAAREFLTGTHGPPIDGASFVLMEDGHIRSVSFVTEFEDIPLIAVTATEKVSKRTGLASHLIECSLDALARQGRLQLRLVVTRSNVPAVRAYEKLGFVPE